MTHRSDAPMLAADLGGTKITSALVRADGGVVAEYTVATAARRGPEAILTDLQAALAYTRECAHAAGEAEPHGIGIGSAGVVDTASGTITAATDAIPGWPGTPVGARTTATLGLPCHVLNDVHAHGLGEAVHGAGVGRAAMLMVAVGTGIGGAIVRDGRVVTGCHGAAAHIGHMPVPEAAGVPCTCGRSGHAEGLASGPGMLAAYHRAGGEATDTRDVVACAQAGEPLATHVLSTCAVATGRMIGALLNVCDVDIVVLSGGLAHIGRPWWDGVRDGVAREAMDLLADTPLLPATAGAHAALLGAAHFARDRI